jgi:hypothetical protein
MDAERIGANSMNLDPIQRLVLHATRIHHGCREADCPLCTARRDTEVELVRAELTTPHIDFPAPGSCGCRDCIPDAWWLVVCPECGNKRCPRADNHNFACTNSNEPGQTPTLVIPPMGNVEALGADSFEIHNGATRLCILCDAPLSPDWPLNRCFGCNPTP